MTIEREPWRLLFVCSGNICRSPLAEALARSVALQIGVVVECRSAGTLMIEDYPADAHAIMVGNELGLDLTPHRSQGVHESQIRWAHWIPVMEARHALWIRDHFPEADSKLLLLGSMIGRMDIADPIGRSLREFRNCRDELKPAIEAFLSRLPKTGKARGL